jgi:hypothetical protein
MYRIPVLCCFFCLPLVACSPKGQFGAHPPYRATGRVLVNGKPAAGIDLYFFHDGDWGENTATPHGFTDKEGRFKLSTYFHEDGAPAGHYFVRATWPAYRRGKDIGPDKFADKYANPDTSGIEVEITSGVNELPLIELTMDQTRSKTRLKGK